MTAPSPHPISPRARPSALLSALLLGAALVSCRSDHHVSAFPESLDLQAWLSQGNIDEPLARIHEEMAAEGMHGELEIRGKFEDASPYVIQGYKTHDRVQGDRYAVRVATRYGVIMAAGPSTLLEARHQAKTRLVKALLVEGAWRSGTDFNGDKMPDVVLAAQDGTLEIWALHPGGSSPYPLVSGLAPTEAVEIDGDGQPDLQGRLCVRTELSKMPQVREVLTFRDGSYRNDTEAVRAYHQKQLRMLEEPETVEVQPDGGVASEGPEPKLGRIIERLWHHLRAGQKPNEAFPQADKEVQTLGPLPAGVSKAWAQWRARLAQVATRTDGELLGSADCAAGPATTREKRGAAGL